MKTAEDHWRCKGVVTALATGLRTWLSHIALALCAVMSLNILVFPLTYLAFRLRQDYY